MRTAAVLLAAGLLVSGCGGKKATSAAEVAPRSTTALLSLPAGADDPQARRALALLPGGAEVERLLARTSWARVGGRRVEVAVLPGGAAAFVLPDDRKRLDAALDAAGLTHIRVRGWTVFAPRRAVLEAVAHAKEALAGARWYAAAARATRAARTSLALRGESRWSAYALGLGSASRTTPGGAMTMTQPLAARVPSDAVAAVVDQNAAELLRRLPFAAELEQGFGLRVEDLARLAPRSGVLYIRGALPIPSVTVVSQGAHLAAARVVARALDPAAPPATAETLDGFPVSHLALGAIDLYYGLTDGATVLTDDPNLRLDPPRRLEPEGLPQETAGWIYLDVPRGLPALAALAGLGGTPLSAGFVARLAGLRDVLVYRTHTAGSTTLTIRVRRAS